MANLFRHAVKFFLAAGGLVMLAILVLQVVFRYVFQWPIFGAEELARIVAMWIYFVAGAYALVVGEHICADVRDLFNLPKNIEYVIDIVIKLAVLVGSVLLAWFCTKYTWWVYESKELTPGLWWPRYIMVSATSVGSIAMTVISLMQLIKQLLALKPVNQRRQ